MMESYIAYRNESRMEHCSRAKLKRPRRAGDPVDVGADITEDLTGVWNGVYTCNTTPTELTLELTQDSTHTGLTQFPLAGSFDFVTRPVETSAAQANRVAQLQALFGGALQGSVGAPATTATAAAQQTAADAAAAAAAAAATAGPRKTLAGCVCRKEWSFEGKVYKGCANPDGHRDEWCFFTANTCIGKPEGGNWDTCAPPPPRPPPVPAAPGAAGGANYVVHIGGVNVQPGQTQQTITLDGTSDVALAEQISRLLTQRDAFVSVHAGAPGAGALEDIATDSVSVLLSTVTCYANRAHNLTRSP